MTMPTMMLTASHRLKCAAGSLGWARDSLRWPSPEGGGGTCGDAMRVASIPRFSTTEKCCGLVSCTRQPTPSPENTPGKCDRFLTIQRGHISASGVPQQAERILVTFLSVQFSV